MTVNMQAKKSVSNAGFVSLFSLFPSLPEVNNNIPGEFEMANAILHISI